MATRAMVKKAWCAGHACKSSGEVLGVDNFTASGRAESVGAA